MRHGTFLVLSRLRFKMSLKFKTKEEIAGISPDIKKGKDGLWNMHFHFIIESSYLDMKSHKKTGEDSRFVKEWKQCTNGSGVLQIKRVRNYEGALDYILIEIHDC